MALGNKEAMARNIKKYMEKRNIDRHKICADLGIKYSTFSEWVQGNAYPRIDKIELMANYFGCSKADLVEETPSLESQIVIEYKKLDDRQKARLLEYARLLRHLKDDEGGDPK